ncbi:hypothetical protein H9Q72_003509 [Fusarium xylarioides]|uniref:Peptidase S8/S53 domain-containing protein n=1 Tax=Fusarium xylarioides TaxID=221167 RepID=A0A9P7I6K7_9HYPO|nr:hypothetical protein H9Q72_003509 [Fusarium xylarioides]
MASSSVPRRAKAKDNTSRVASTNGGLKASKGSRTTTAKSEKIDAKGILKAALEVDFTNKNQVASFETQYKERLMGTRSRARNILCVLAKKEDLSHYAGWSDAKTKEFLHWILKGYHNLLEYQDGTPKTYPMHSALQQKHTAFINGVLGFPDLININKVLTVEGQYGNALHIALDSCPSSFSLLVNRCSQFASMFTAKRPISKNTPLHDCVSVNFDADDDEEEDEYEYEDGEMEVEESGDESDDDFAISTASDEEHTGQFGSVNRRHSVNNRTGHLDVLAMERTQSIKATNNLEYPADRFPYVELLIESSDSALYCYNDDNRTPYQERLHQLEAYFKRLSTPLYKDTEFEDWATKDPIASYIRSYCVRNFTRNKVTKCLYYTGKEKQIEFDLGGLGRDTISDEYLERLSDHLKFESILKYVALPKLAMEGRPRAPKSRNPVTLIPASKLEQVNLYIRDGYEHPDRLTRYIDDFRVKVKERSKRSINVSHFRDDRSTSHASEIQGRVVDSQRESPWIHCMLRLSRLLEPACLSTKVNPVKVAIIDDGVDVSLESLRKKIAFGQSFCPYANSTDMMSPYFVSMSNHGTSMATLICNICPMVKLYIARLDQRQTSNISQRHITADSAAQAVLWATDCGVDIISMSWTIETPVPGNPEMESLQEAVRRASNHNIVMFCSTSDQGSMTNDHNCYPGDFGGCIRIGSASNTGDAMSWVKVEKVDFLLPGSNVPFSVTEGKTNLHESGSSIATAAASGLAAFLMACSWLLDEKDSYFKDYNNMKRAFHNLAQGHKFPAVSERLEKLFMRKLERIQGKDEKTVSELPLEWSEECQRALGEIINGIKDTT